MDLETTFGLVSSVVLTKVFTKSMAFGDFLILENKYHCFFETYYHFSGLKAVIKTSI